MQNCTNYGLDEVLILDQTEYLNKLASKSLPFTNVTEILVDENQVFPLIQIPQDSDGTSGKNRKRNGNNLSRTIPKFKLPDNVEKRFLQSVKQLQPVQNITNLKTNHQISNGTVKNATNIVQISQPVVQLVDIFGNGFQRRNKSCSVADKTEELPEVNSILKSALTSDKKVKSGKETQPNEKNDKKPRGAKKSTDSSRVSRKRRKNVCSVESNEDPIVKSANKIVHRQVIDKKQSVENAEQNLDSVEDVVICNSDSDDCMEEIRIDLVTEDENSDVSPVLSPTVEEVPATTNILTCRTCLKPTPSDQSYSIYAKGENRKNSRELRKRLRAVLGPIDFLASFDPVVCEHCLKSVNRAYLFKRQAEYVEDEIERRKNSIGGQIDLTAMLEDIESEKVKKINDLDNDISARIRNRPAKHLGLNQYLDKRKNIIDNYVNSFTADNSSLRYKYLKHPNEKKNVTNQQILTNPEISSTNLKDILQNGDIILEIFDDDEEKLKNKVHDLNGTVLKVLDSNLTASVTKTTVLSQKDETPVIKISLPAPESEKSSKIVPENSKNAARKNSETIPLNPVSNGSKHVAPILPKLLFEHERDGTLNDFLTQRKEQCQKLIEGRKRSGKLINLIDDTIVKKRRTSCETQESVFDVESNRKKEPELPKTFKNSDLFNANKDKYFKDLEDEITEFCILEKPPYVCQNCGDQFEEKETFNQHILLHTDSELATCSYCGIEISKDRLNSHVMAKHKPLNFECEKCDEKFSLKCFLTSHMSTVHSENTSEHSQCSVCGIVLKKRSLREHMKRHNSNLKKHICVICRKVFKNQATWHAHRKKHLDSEVYSCNICSQTVKGFSNLKEHVKSLHESAETKNCNICGMALSKKTSLMKHLRIKHGSKPRVLRGRNREITKEPLELNQEKEETIVVPELEQSETCVSAEPEDILSFETVVDEAMPFEELIPPLDGMSDMFFVD